MTTRLEFSCPICDSDMYGTSDSAGPIDTWCRYCSECRFQWYGCDDWKYFQIVTRESFTSWEQYLKWTNSNDHA